MDWPRLINLPRWGDPGCDPNATTANFVLSFSVDSSGLRFGPGNANRLFDEIKFDNTAFEIKR